MKKILVILILLCPLLVFVGAHWHAPILSILDGVSYLQDESQAVNFEISPEMASFIHQELLHYGEHHWGVGCIVACVYVDGTSYYVLEYNYAIFGKSDVPPSYYAKRFGIRMNATDGRIYDPARGEWIGRGYVHCSREEFASKISSGMTTFAVKHAVGTPFGEDSSGSYVIWHYWCADGEIVVTFLGGEVESVRNATFIRV